MSEREDNYYDVMKQRLGDKLYKEYLEFERQPHVSRINYAGNSQPFEDIDTLKHEC